MFGRKARRIASLERELFRMELQADNERTMAVLWKQQAAGLRFELNKALDAQAELRLEIFARAWPTAD
jgi:hypothetical protein